jgi:hypothetical protein
MRYDLEITIRVAKAHIWEEAKGKLRALYAVNGQVPSHEAFSPHWEDVKKAVEQFIKEFEEDGFHE